MPRGSERLYASYLVALLTDPPPNKYWIALPTAYAGFPSPEHQVRGTAARICTTGRTRAAGKRRYPACPETAN